MTPGDPQAPSPAPPEGTPAPQARPLDRVFSPLPRATITLPPAPPRGPLVTPVDWSAGDRLTAQMFWASTEKDQTAWACPETEITRILNFGLKAEPVVHGTPFGHGHLTVHVDRVPLPIVGQLIRHRVQHISGDLDWLPNVSQKSYRYVAARGDLDEVVWVPEPGELRQQLGRPGAYVYEPIEGSRGEGLALAMEQTMAASWRTYQSLIEQGLAPEQARMVLPQGTLTRLYLTASYRNWLTWLVQRNDRHAQEEIQQVARQVEQIIAQCIPLTYDLWESHGRRPL